MQVTSGMNPQANSGPTARPFLFAGALAGFMTPENVQQHIPNFSELPASTQRQIQERFGRAAALAPRPQLKDAFKAESVVEPDVVDLLRGVSEGIQWNPSNLMGFEWVDPACLVAGRLLTQSLTRPAQQLPLPMAPLDIARYSLFAAGLTPPRWELRGNAVVCDVPVAVHPENMELAVGADQVVTIRYQMVPVLAPIHVVLVKGVALAVSGLERIALLMKAGISRVLAVVHYGHGLDTLEILPRIDEALHFGERPPLVADFSDTALATTIPTVACVSVTTFRADTLVLSAR